MQRAMCTIFLSTLIAAAHAQETKTQPSPLDEPMSMRAIEAVCTGVTSDTRFVSRS